MKLALGVLASLPFLLLACDQPTTADLEAEFCNNLDQLSTALDELAAVNAQSQVRDLRSARDNAASAYRAVQDSAAAVQSSRMADMQAAYDNLDSTVNNISGRETVGEAARQVVTALAEVQATREQVDAEVNCP
ncbi:MAG: hypothetical protein HC929_17200 [Leptolyngbyaceae cyanobacterium SM2_5_2]|nr:hypothetical protein [Leptolyngbyaceae cyanobacterium SM2_5_2]